jgi:hypothetical protein
MIATDVVREIRLMLADGKLSQRAIAVRMGVSRGTVNAIAQGKRADYSRRGLEKDFKFVPPAGRLKRCPICGALVRMPCLACYLDSWKRRRVIPEPERSKTEF